MSAYRHTADMLTECYCLEDHWMLPGIETSCMFACLLHEGHVHLPMQMPSYHTGGGTRPCALVARADERGTLPDSHDTTTNAVIQAVLLDASSASAGALDEAPRLGARQREDASRTWR